MSSQERKPLPARRDIRELKDELGVSYTTALRIYEDEVVRTIKNKLGISYADAFRIFETEQNSESSQE